MPPWGRPSGAREGKRKKGDAKRTRQWEENRRFEEIDSDDDDDGQGVGLNNTYPSDELHFTGEDLGLRIRRRRRHDHNYTYSSGSSDENSESEEQSGDSMQLALRDKEEMLVQRALERIRRAQMLGKTNVKLTQHEIDALERKRRKEQAKPKSTEAPSKGADRRRSSGYFGFMTKNDKKLGQRNSKDLIPRYSKSGSSSPARVTSPGMIVPGSDGNSSHVPFAYYAPSGSTPLGRSSRSGSRSTSSHNLQQLSPPLAPNQSHSQQRRYVSVLESSQPSPSSRSPPLPRRLPDDPNWIPRPRSASSNQPYPSEPFQYQTHSPPLPQMPVQYSQGRRNVSGPPEVQYSSVRRVVPPAHPYAASSDPSLLRQEYIEEVPSEATPSEDDSDYDDDAENSGVQVDVVPYEGGGYGINTGPEVSSVRRQRRSLR